MTYVADGGNVVAVAAKVIRVPGPGRWLDPGPLGTLGVGAPFAIAAKLLAPERPVCVIQGDGAFGLNGMDFDTAVRFGLPMVVVVGNDAAWGQIRVPQRGLYGEEHAVATTLAPTRYDRVVEALGGKGRARGGPGGPRAGARAGVRLGDGLLRGRRDRPGGGCIERRGRVRYLTVLQPFLPLPRREPGERVGGEGEDTMKLKLDRSRTAVLVIDIQSRLTPAMPPDALASVVKYTRALVGAAKELGLPVLATEQYPKGLGNLIPEVREVLPTPPLEKVHFSCGADPAFAAALEKTGRRQVVVCGMETHVCVFQTVRDLVAAGYEVHVCSDAVSSRTEEHRRTGLELCREAGAIVTTAETAIFDLLHEAATPEFKKVAPLVK